MISLWTKQGVACESVFCVIFLLYFFLWNDLLNCSPVSVVSTTFCDTQSQIGRCRIVSILITGAIHQKRTSRRCFYLRAHSRFEFQIGHYKITSTLIKSLLICTWILKFLVWKIKFNELDFFVYFELDFYCLQKSSLK